MATDKEFSKKRQDKTFDKEYYLKKADENLPEIFSEEIRVFCDVRELKKGDSIVLDLGNHYVGYFSFVLGYLVHVYKYITLFYIMQYIF